MLRKIGIAVAVVVVGAVVFVLGLRLSAEGSSGLAPIDVPSAHIPPDAEAWSALEQAMALRGPETHATALRDGQPPDPDQVAIWVQDEAALAAVSAVFSSGALSIPVPEDAQGPGANLGPLIQLARASELRGWEQLGSDSLAAIDGVLAPAEWGVVLKDSEGDMVSFALGATLVQGSLDQLDQLLRVLDGDRVAQEYAHSRLLELPSRRSAQRAAAVECRLTEGVYADVDAMQQEPQGGVPGWSFIVLYDAEVTVDWHRQHCSAVLEQLERPWRNRLPVELQSHWQDAGFVRFAHNPIGRILQDVAQPNYSAILEREDLALATRAGLIAVLSARLGLVVPTDDALGGAVILEGGEVRVDVEGELAGEPRDLRWPIHGLGD